MATAEIPISSHLLGTGVQELRRLRQWQLTGTPTSPVEGLFWMDTNSGNKRLYFYDGDLAASVPVPRLDRTETWTAKPAFNAYFSVPGTTVITNLNASFLADTSNVARAGDTAATVNTYALRDSSGRLKAVDPAVASDVATKAYVDATAQGLHVKEPCRVATAAALPTNSRSSNTLTASSNGSINGTGVDGVTTLAINDRILVKNESNQVNNGLYSISALGDGSNPWAMVRTTDADTTPEVPTGTYTTITAGSTNSNSSWYLTSLSPVLNTDPLVFTLFFQAGTLSVGNGLVQLGTVFSVLVSGSSTYSQGGLLYHGSSTTLSSAVLTGVLKGNGTGAPTTMTGATNRVTFWSDANTISSDTNLTWNGSTLAATGALTVSSTINSQTITSAASFTGSITTQLWGLFGANGAFGTLPNVPGTYVSWNKTAGGKETNFINHYAVGSGGFTFDITPDNTTYTRLLTIASTGNLTIVGAISATNFTGFANPSGTQVGLNITNGTATTALRSDCVLALDQTISPSWTGSHQFKDNGLGATTVDLVLFENATAASAGAQQWSPAIAWQGRGWKTNSTAASQSVRFHSYVVPVQGSANPTGYLTFESSVNGGSFGGSMSLTTGGFLGLGTTSPSTLLHVYSSGSGGAAIGTIGYFQANGSVGTPCFISVISGANSNAGLFLGNSGSTSAGGIYYDNAATTLNLLSGGSSWLSISAAGVVNLPQLTVSELVQTDGSGNLVSSNTLPAGSLGTINATTGSVAAIKWFNVGDGSSTSITLTHNFNTRDIVIQLYENGSGYYTPLVAFTRPTVNTVVIEFAVAPTLNQYRAALIVGL